MIITSSTIIRQNLEREKNYNRIQHRCAILVTGFLRAGLRISNFLLLLSLFLFPLPPLSRRFAFDSSILRSWLFQNLRRGDWRRASTWFLPEQTIFPSAKIHLNPFFKEPNSSFRPVSVEKLTSLLIFFPFFCFFVFNIPTWWTSKLKFKWHLFFWTFKNSYQNVWKNCRHCYLELSFWSWIETLILELEISSKDISNERK